MTTSVGFLNSYLVDGQLSFWGRGHGAVTWSIDNQVVIVHRKGVDIFECHQTQGFEDRLQVLTAKSSQIDGPGRIYPPNTGEVTDSDVMNGSNKYNIFELARDPILRPHGYDATVFLNHFIKADWSTLPLYGGKYNESRCILGVLTSCHQLLIYGRINRRYLTSDDWKEPWEVVVNITSRYNRILLDEWELSPGTEGKFNTYKNRLYQLAIVDFLWLPDWKVDPDLKCPDEARGVFKTNLMTFHANGDVCLWRIKASKSVKPTFSANVLYKKNIIRNNDILSCAAYSLVSSALGLLVVGTNKGRLKAFRIEKRKRVKAEKGTKNRESFHKYVIHDEEVLWGEDGLRVDSILLRPQSVGRKKVTIMAVKNPDIIIGSTLSVLSLKMLSDEFNFVRVPGDYGPISGFVENADGLFFALRESGVITVVRHNGDELVHLPEYEHQIFDPAKVKKKKNPFLGGPVQKLDRPKKKLKVPTEKRLIFQGMAISPNRTMLCVGRTMGMYYDHLRIRRPSHIVFLSLLPKDCMWSYVQKLYAENQYSLRVMADVLVPFRFYLRGNGHENIYKELMEWAVPLEEKSVEELRLLYWCLRIRPGCPETEYEVAFAEKMFNPRSMRRLQAVERLTRLRADVVADRIMQHRCATLIRIVSENQDEAMFSLEDELNKQSLTAMYTFLESKAEPPALPSKPEFNPLPHIPLCYWCKGPIEFPLEPVDDLTEFGDVLDELKVEFDDEKLTGFKWKSRRHPVKEYGIHRPEVCILSLLPLKFPYRKCNCCSVFAIMNPPFGQRPYCPLCNSYMYPITLPVKGHEGVEKQEPGTFEIPEITFKVEPRHQMYPEETTEIMDPFQDPFQDCSRIFPEAVNIEGEASSDWVDESDASFDGEMELCYGLNGTLIHSGGELVSSSDSDDSSSSESDTSKKTWK